MKSLIDEINIEIDKRIEEMETEDYHFPENITKVDWLGIAGIALVCLIIIIATVLFYQGL
ncbi:MAG: hypothetical protein RR385_10305 [Clostridiales bacterium]